MFLATYPEYHIGTCHHRRPFCLRCCTGSVEIPPVGTDLCLPRAQRITGGTASWFSGKCWESNGNTFADSDASFDRLWPLDFPCQHSVSVSCYFLGIEAVGGVNLNLVLLWTRHVYPCESGAACSRLHSGRVLAQDFTAGQSLNGQRWCLAAMSVILQRWWPDMMAWVRIGSVGEGKIVALWLKLKLKTFSYSICHVSELLSPMCQVDVHVVDSPSFLCIPYFDDRRGLHSIESQVCGSCIPWYMHSGIILALYWHWHYVGIILAFI